MQENDEKIATEKEYSRPRPVRLNELDKPVDDYIEKTGIRFSELVKKSLNQFLSGRSPEREIDFSNFTIELKNLRVDLSRVGGNLNQIAHYLNVHGTLDNIENLSNTHQELRVKFRQITETLKAVQDEIKRSFN